ncbi:MAG: undecaprenyl/decaprenyl-phosphate alpha-N-acetylglucosaminyl 1-phosphate transferase [Actinomycetota bacterium]|nr:MAG: undecaprenyl/decaprenyl-phosphate alpha-N-acetylglucosaminyl 1-phosphate transferase [Actinomycetota bacterium]
MTDTAGYLIVGGVAAVVTFSLVPVVARLARWRGWVVEPDDRRVHQKVTPDVGGIAMYAGFVAALGLAWWMDRFDPLFDRNSEPLGVVLAATLIFGLGFIDDIREISAPAKVTGTVVTGLVLVWFGVTMYYFRVPFLEVFVLSDDWIPLITVLWLLGMTTAVNLIDGLDGLAAGIVAIAAGAFFLYSRRLEDLGVLVQPNVGPLIAVITLGICIGFLPHNFNPARIFMGDGGAMLLGLLLAAATSVVGGRADPNSDQYLPGQTYFFLAPLFIPLVVLGVPIVDTLFAIVRRATRRQGVATADKGHLHHRLMDLGHGQRRSVLILWLWTALLSGFALYPIFTRATTPLIPIGLIAIALGLYTVLHPEVRRGRRGPSADADVDGLDYDDERESDPNGAESEVSGLSDPT